MKIGIVTGASSGLGREFVMQIAKKEKELEEIWIIARRKERLARLQKVCPVRLRILPLDLTEASAITELERLLAVHEPDVRLLVNAAGFGKIGNYKDVPHGESARMIALNCTAPTEITQICLPYMQRGSRILMICSTAAFQPFPYLNVYAASKAFLYRYSRALRVELRPRRIVVTAVCPYWIKDTEFIPLAKSTDQGHSLRHYPLSSRVRSVASHALADSRLGMAVSTPGLVCTLHRIAAKCIPSALMMQLWQLLRRV